MVFRPPGGLFGLPGFFFIGLPSARNNRPVESVTLPPLVGDVVGRCFISLATENDDAVGDAMVDSRRDIVSRRKPPNLPKLIVKMDFDLSGLRSRGPEPPF